MPDWKLCGLLHGKSLVLEGKQSEGKKAVRRGAGPDPDPEELTLMAKRLDPTPELRGGDVSPLVQPYWNRALERTKALGYDQASDKDKLSLMVLVAF